MDQGYVFGTYCLYPFDDRDRAIASFYPLYFTNFAKYGNPTPQAIRDVVWEPLETPMGFNYLSIDVQPQMKPYFNFEAVQFWTETVPTIKLTFRESTGNIDLNMKPKYANLVETQKQNANQLGSANVLGIALGVVGATILLAVIVAALVIRVKRNRRAKKLLMTEFQPLRDYDSEIYYQSF